MSKFVIECPSCGRFMEASTGFFAAKTMECFCGYTINVKKECISSKECTYCGNVVLYNQAERENAKCPICNNKLITDDMKGHMREISCPSCSCKLSIRENTNIYSCPLCETKIDVQSQLEKEKVRKQGIASVIKYEGDNLVWKHPVEDFNLGSQLIVHESQEAIFFKDGKALDLFGAGRYTLATQSLPMLENLYKLPSNANEIFHSEVYFLNLTVQMGIKWGTDSKVRLFDPASGMYIEIGASGSFNIRVQNSRKLLLKLVGTKKEFIAENIEDNVFETKNIISKFKALIINKIKSNLARAIKEKNINILEIDSYMDILSEYMRNVLNETLEDYGLYMPEFFITTILTPDNDPNYKRLKQQFADRVLKVREEEIRKIEAEAAQGRKIVEAQTEAQLKIVGAQGEAEALKIKEKAGAEAYKMKAKAEAEEMQMKGYTYQQETARQVGLEAMKNGINGNASGGVLGDVAGVGVTLGAMGSVINMTKEVLNPIMADALEFNSNTENQMMTNLNLELSESGWNCNCGAVGITSKFCPECGAKKIERRMVKGWNCDCGAMNNMSKFCPECGCKKPEEDS